MPDDQKLRLHYHDANVSADPGSPDNPLTTLKDVYKPGDYVLFKVCGMLTPTKVLCLDAANLGFDRMSACARGNVAPPRTQPASDF